MADTENCNVEKSDVDFCRMSNPACRLCGGFSCKMLNHTAWKKRMEGASLLGGSHWHCQSCDLIFLRTELLPQFEAEKERYQAHKNREGDLKYLQAFSSLVGYLVENSPIHERGKFKILDYGSGPVPVLASYLRTLSFQVDIYDPFFAPRILEEREEYKYILATEVVEHFHSPSKDFEIICNIAHVRSVASSKILSMTQFHQGPERFQDWWYARDITHVAFYSQRTFEWITREYDVEILKFV